MSAPRFDNIGVSRSDGQVRVIQTESTKQEAEDISEKLVALHGNEMTEFYEVPAGTYSTGDAYQKEDVEMNAFRDRRRALVEVIDEHIHFLQQQRADIGKSPDSTNGGAIHHVNMRLLLQVHVTNLIETSSSYDRSVYALLEAQRNNTKKGKK